MTIPDRIADFLENATIAIAGTRDRSLVPHVHRPSGWVVSPDRRTIACLFPESFLEHLLDSLADNGQMALTVSEVPSHETYQLKGSFVRSEPVGSDDLAVHASLRERVVERLGTLYGFSEETVVRNIPAPVVRVLFEVREIYDQTPGPEAGRRLELVGQG